MYKKKKKSGARKHARLKLVPDSSRGLFHRKRLGFHKNAQEFPACSPFAVGFS